MVVSHTGERPISEFYSFSLYEATNAKIGIYSLLAIENKNLYK